jgi:hypothetical protein
MGGKSNEKTRDGRELSRNVVQSPRTINYNGVTDDRDGERTKGESSLSGVALGEGSTPESLTRDNSEHFGHSKRELRKLSISSQQHFCVAPFVKVFFHSTHYIMASSLRIGSSILRSSSLLSRPVVQKAAFNGVRCASSKVPEAHIYDGSSLIFPSH